MRRHRLFSWIVAALLLLGDAAWVRAQFWEILFARRDAADVVLEWSDVGNAVSYDVFRTTSPAIPPVLIGRTSGTSFRDVGAAPGPPTNPPLYLYHVEAVDAGGGRSSSNVAHKVNVAVYCKSGTTCENAIALPYFYVPAGVGTIPTAEDVCNENPAVRRVGRFLGACQDTRQFHVCGAPVGDFDIRQGEGYLVVVDRDTTLDIVGSYDDDFRPGAAKTVLVEPCGTCPDAALVSPPCHMRATTAEEICAETAATGTPLDAVDDFVSDLEVFVRHRCGSPRNDFALVPGKGYMMIAKEPVPWQPEVY